MSTSRAARIAGLKISYQDWRITERFSGVTEINGRQVARHAGYQASRNGHSLIAATPDELQSLLFEVQERRGSVAH